MKAGIRKELGRFMISRNMQAMPSLRLLLLFIGLNATQAPSLGENQPPKIAILYPRSGDGFSGELVKIKALANGHGSIAKVEFYAETNLIGVATNLPYNIVSGFDLSGPFKLRAIAQDSKGTRSESFPVYLVGGLLRPDVPVVEIVWPRDGAYFAAPATFVFSAEVLASEGDAGPVEFFINQISLGVVDAGARLTATRPPSSITVSNLQEGEYKLNVRYLGENGLYCQTCYRTNTIHVVKLAVQSPTFTSDGHLQFEIVTSFPGVQTVVQASSDLAGWTSVSTNFPSGNSFLFTETTRATEARHFYRVVLPNQ